MRLSRWLLTTGWMALAFAAACSVIQRPPPTATPLPTPDRAARQLQVFEAVWTAVRDRYVRADHDGVDWKATGDEYRAAVKAGMDGDAFARAMRDMLALLPGGLSSFQTRAERLEAETSDAARYEGIGVFYSFREVPEPHVVVLSVIENAPAEQAGLQAHDSIYAIDGEPIGAGEARSVFTRIRGPVNTSVSLTVQTPGERRRDVMVERGQITTSDVLRGGHIRSLDIAYYRIPVVANSEMVNAMAQSLTSIAEQATLKGVVLDLRIARSAGAAWPLGEMLALFADGDFGEFYTRTTTDTLTIQGQNLGGSQTLPLVILIGPDTEGSPEIFASALRGARRAVLLGLPTPGEVEGFSEISLPDGSRLLLATSSYRTPDGADLSLEGVTPDLRVNHDWDEISNQDDPVLEAALALLSVE